MDEKLREEIKRLQQLRSADAASWLIETYPQNGVDCGEAIKLMEHVSWKRPDQIRLAEHYLVSIPFASGKTYEVFASFMSVKNLIRAIGFHLPKEESDISLLRYYLEPVLMKSAKSQKELEVVKLFLSELNQ